MHSEMRHEVSEAKGMVLPEEEGFSSLGDGFGLKRSWILR